MGLSIFRSRSKTLALTFARAANRPSSPFVPVASSQYHHALHPFSSSLVPSNARGSTGTAAAVSLYSPFGPGKVFLGGRNQVLYGWRRDVPLWSSAVAQYRGLKNQSDNSRPELSQSTAEENKDEQSGIRWSKFESNQLDTKEVMLFSPLEGSTIGKRALVKESLKIKRSELSQKVTLYLIPALLLVSKNSFTTSLLIFSVYWQIYGFFKEIFLDYVHQEVTRNWVLIYFQLLLLISAKDTILYFNLV